MYRIKPNVGAFENIEINNIGVYFVIKRFSSLKARLVTAKNRVALVKVPELVKLAVHAQSNGRQTEAKHVDENIDKVLFLERVTIKYAETKVTLIENYLNKEYLHKTINIEHQFLLLKESIDIVEREIESIENFVHTL